MDSESEGEDLFTVIPTLPRPRPDFRGPDTMSAYSATKHANDPVISGELKLNFVGSDSVSFFPGPPACQREHSARTMLKNERDGDIRTLPSFHELDIHLQEDSNLSGVKQVLGAYDTLSLFPEIKMDVEEAKTSMPMHAMEDYRASHGSQSGMTASKRKHDLPLQQPHEAHDKNPQFARLLYETLPRGLPKTLLEEHSMMFGDDVQRREEEDLNTHVRNQVCQSLQSGDGSLISFRSAPSREEHSFLSPFPSFLSSYPEENETSFSSSLLNSGELSLSLNTVRKLETVGGKKNFSSPYQDHSGPGSSNSENSVEYKFINHSAAYPASVYESTTLFSTNTLGNFGETLVSPSSMPFSFTQNLISTNLRDEYKERHWLSPGFDASPNCVESVKAFDMSISNRSRIDDFQFQDLGMSHGYTVEHLQNKSKSTYFRPTDTSQDHGLTVFYPAPGSSTILNQPISVESVPSSTADKEGSALKGYRDVLLASFCNSTSSHVPTYIEDHRPELSKPLKVLDEEGFISPDECSVRNVTVKRSGAISIQRREHECTNSNDSWSNATNPRKEKRWIYKQARLPMKRSFSNLSDELE